MKKIIGLIGRPDYTPLGQEAMVIYNSLRKIVSANDCIPLGILPVSQNSYLKNEKEDLDIDSFEKILSMCDGFIMQGGDLYYNYDLVAIKYAHNNDIPILGICLGMQTMAVYLGGFFTEIKNKKLHKAKNSAEYIHNVIIKEDSFLYSVIGKKEILVNSLHKDTVTRIPNKYISGTHKETIEAIEDKTKRFFLGIQWHPEYLNDENSLKIFNIFFKTIKEYQK